MGVFVYFGASWCHWCQKLDPIWKSAGEVLKNRGAAITLPKVECTKDTALCQEHQVHALPHPTIPQRPPRSSQLPWTKNRERPGSLRGKRCCLEEEGGGGKGGEQGKDAK